MLNKGQTQEVGRQVSVSDLQTKAQGDFAICEPDLVLTCVSKTHPVKDDKML